MKNSKSENKKIINKLENEKNRPENKKQKSAENENIIKPEI